MTRYKNSPAIDEVTVVWGTKSTHQFGHHNTQTWLAWRDFMGHQWHPGNKTVFEVFEELIQLKEDNPDMWAAFVAAQRIQGKNVWDTGAT